VSSAGIATRSPSTATAIPRQVIRAERGDGGVTTTVVADTATGLWQKLAEQGEPLSLLGQAIRQVDAGLADHWAFGGRSDEGGTVDLVALPLVRRVGVYPAAEGVAMIVIDTEQDYLTQFGDSVVADEWDRVHAEYGLFSFILDSTTDRVLYLSPQIESVTGVSRVEILADPTALMRHVIPEDLPLVAPFQSAVRSKGVASADLRVCDDRDRIQTIRFRCTLVLDHQPPLIIGVCRDVSEIVALNDQARTLLRGIEQSREGFMVTNALGRVVYMNRETCKLFGLESALKILGQPWEILHDAETVALIKAEALPELGRSGSWSGNITVRRVPQPERHQNMILSVMPDGSVVWSSRDCTEELSMRNRLIESQRLFHNVVEHMPSGLLIKHLDGRYAYINPRARDYLTADAFAAQTVADPAVSPTMSEVINQTDYDLLSKELADRIRAADETVSITKRTLVEDFHGTVAESSRIFSAVRFPVLDENREVWRVATLLEDVTDQRQLQRDMKDLVERRGQLLTMQREFVSLVSHEFRTPLAALQGTLYLLRKHLKPEGDAKLTRYLDLQTNALATLKDLVDQVLLLNRIEHATGEAKLAEVDLSGLINRIGLDFNDSTAKARVTIEAPMSGSCPLRLDESLIRAAVDNLISNALKYSPADSDVRVTLAPMAEGWRISVRDHGRGVPPSDQLRLFQPFFRASNVGTISGTGLGLTIVKRAAELHGGSAGIISSAGDGSTFFIDLPAAIEVPAARSLAPAWPAI
jgi:signal transduction histidine kinase